MTDLGTEARPLRVAVVGSGPSAFYAIEHLQRQPLAIDVDCFDRLPTPFGLVRGGVAPDHQKIKSVTRVYERLAGHPRFRFLGHVTVGRDLGVAELARHYDAVIWAVGAQADRALGVPGEELPGSHAATEFVGWYNGHPDYRDLTFDLGQDSVAVVGVGNVAMDVTRVLAKTPDELAGTDIATHALEALRRSRVRTIHLLGRRGPAQAAFTTPEIKELGELADADVIVDPAELVLDPHTEALLAAAEDRTAEKNLEVLREFAARRPSGKSRRIVIRFCVSPLALEGHASVERVRLGRNRLVPAGTDVKAEPAGEAGTIPAGLVFRSVGYRGVAVPGVPFDERRGTIPHEGGRVLAAPGGARLAGHYCVGWIKRGPSGVIGTNKPDAVESAEALLADLRAGALPAAPERDPAAIPALLADRGVRVVGWADWKALDAIEQERGRAQGRPREKFTRIGEMLAALGDGAGARAD